MRIKSEPTFLAAGAFIGLTVGVAAVQQQALVMLALAAATIALLGSRPILVVAAVLLFEENFPGSPYFEQSPSVLTAGWNLYDRRTAGFSPAFALLVVAGAGLLVRLAISRRRGRPTRQRQLDGAIVVLIGLTALSAAVSLLQESSAISPRTAPHLLINAILAGLPWLSVLLSYFIGTNELRAAAASRRLTRLTAGTLIGKGVIGLVVLVLFGGATVDAQQHVIFYDAALPAVAAACLLGYLLAPSSSRARLWCIAMSASVVVLSFRRAVWLGLVAGFLLLPLARKRSYVVARAIGVVAAGMIIVALLPAGVRSTTFGRVVSAISVAETGRGESSAKAHESDVEAGLQAAKEHPLAGIGVRAGQLKTLIHQAAPSLYVHNDFLQTWLRYGLAGLLGLLLLLGVAAQRAWRALSSADSLSVPTAAAAAFCLTIAIPLMTAPFLTTTRRWPIFFGLALAVLRVALERPAPAADVSVGQEREPVLLAQAVLL